MIDMACLIPGFLRKDRNGYALTKALGTGLEILEKTIQSGLDLIFPDTMKDDFDGAMIGSFIIGVDQLSILDDIPEWRLDDMAWEYNSFYDYNAPIMRKREFIALANAYFLRLGTKDCVDYVLACLNKMMLAKASIRVDGSTMYVSVASQDPTVKNTVTEQVKRYLTPVVPVKTLIVPEV